MATNQGASFASHFVNFALETLERTPETSMDWEDDCLTQICMKASFDGKELKGENDEGAQMVLRFGRFSACGLQNLGRKLRSNRDFSIWFPREDGSGLTFARRRGKMMFQLMLDVDGMCVTVADPEGVLSQRLASLCETAT